MDPASYIQTIETILAVLIACCMLRFLRSRNIGFKTRNGKTNRNNEVPEPSGALPFVGHLHLLSAQVPYFRTFSVLAEKYGPIFSLRLGCHQTIVVSSREIAKECLTKNDVVFASRPNTTAGRYMGYDNAVLGFSPYGPYWREIRKIATLELLSSHRLEKLRHVRETEVYSLVKDLYSYEKKKKEENASGSIQVPISNLLDNMTFNIIVQMIAGKRFGAEDTGSEAGRLKRAIKDFTYLSGVFVVADAIPSLSWFDFQGHVSFMKRTAKEIDLILQNWMDEHLRKRAEGENGRCVNDFMDMLILAFGEHDVIYGHKREIVIKATALMLILTASGSTAITLTWALSLLLNHPRVLKSAQEELDTVVGKENWVQESDIKGLKYLQAIVKETLRLYPPAPLTGIREATEDCCVAGYHVSKGTRLFINLWKIHRDPAIWSNPDEFQPERFFATQQDVDFSVGQNFEFVPFSFGRRSCPGVTFGIQVVHLALARLLQGFDISTKNGVRIDMSEGLVGLALPKKNALEIIVEPRLPSELYENL